MTDLEDELHRTLRAARGIILSKLDDLGTAFGRPPARPLPWVADGTIEHGADVWATAAESSRDLVAGYQDACAHADRTIHELPLDAPGSVARWPPQRRDTTLGVMLVQMVTETAQHAGHAAIVRELIDGTGGADHDALTTAEWQAYVAQVRAAADSFRALPTARSATRRTRR